MVKPGGVKTKEGTAKAVKVRSDGSDAEGTSTAGGRDVSSKHRRKEVIGKAEESAGTAENAVISDALALKGIFA
jgi:hypothetical protein